MLPVGRGTEGFRVPDHPIALNLISAAGGALRVTSANVSGTPPAASAMEAACVLGPLVRAVLDGPPAPNGKASTVMKIENGKAVIIREGAVSTADIEACLNR